MRPDTRQYFGLTLKQNIQPGYSVTVSRYQGDVVEPWHANTNPTFFLHLRGDLLHGSRRFEAVLDPLVLVLHPTDVAHRCHIGPGGSVGVTIELLPEWLARHDKKASDLGDYAHIMSPAARVAAMRVLFRSCLDPAAPSDEIEADVGELLGALIHGGMTARTGSPRWLRRVEEYLMEECSESISLRDCAREAGVHPSYLAQVFRAQYGCSVGTFLRRARLLRASQVAFEEEGSLAHAAAEGGFTDQPHFTRVFAAEMGMTPGALLRLRKRLLE
jgi:AraC family transcriptional regulator